jgi:hypothetical protein
MLTLSSSVKMVLRLTFAALLLFLIVALVTTYLLGQTDPKLQQLGYKTVELAIQVFLVVIAGGIVVQEYSRGQARRAALNESRKVMLRQLIQAYSRTKKARRLLRAKCVLMAGDGSGRSERAVDYDAYNEQLGSINETQLDLEIVARELKVIQSGFASSAGLRDYVKAMEKSLNELVDEYESTLGECDPEQSIPLSRLPKLKAFIAKGKDETFSPYSTAFHNALDLIQEEKLKG